MRAVVVRVSDEKVKRRREANVSRLCSGICVPGNQPEIERCGRKREKAMRIKTPDGAKMF